MMNLVKNYEVEMFMSKVAPEIERENRAVKIFSGYNNMKELNEKFYEEFYKKYNK